MPIYKPTKDVEFTTPFGPAMGYLKMPQELVDYLNSHINDELADYSNSLVGKVRNEVSFTPEIKAHVLSYISDFIKDYYFFSIRRMYMDDETKEYDRRSIAVKAVSGWFVRQFNGDYNPLHKHSNCHLSLAGYLALPDGIEQEWEEDYKDHYPSHGHINFATAPSNFIECNNYLVKPQIGDLYIFPAGLFHCVYPFTSIGERRSFSMNILLNKLNKKM